MKNMGMNAKSAVGEIMQGIKDDDLSKEEDIEKYLKKVIDVYRTTFDTGSEEFKWVNLSIRNTRCLEVHAE